mmetsp:Transcript_29161/g.85489  ORF Transcript_29161/g.85489 Transcript_29161/m.85489 type:complete len:203 (-) Transcript_29161:32-640(-)
MCLVHLGEIRQGAVVARGDGADVQLELVLGLLVPHLAKVLPVHHIHGARAKKGPHGSLNGARGGAGHDGDAVVVGELKERARLVHCTSELLLAERGAMGPPHRGLAQLGHGPARVLGAGPRREVGDLGHGGGPRREVDLGPRLLRGRDVAREEVMPWLQLREGGVLDVVLGEEEARRGAQAQRQGGRNRGRAGHGVQHALWR